MIEIFYIIAQILFILTISYFPIMLFENNVYFNSLKFNLLDKLSINLIFFMNLLFLTSILNINTYNILYIYFFIIILFFIFNFKNFNFNKFKINYFLITLLIFIFLISIDIADQIFFSWDTKTNWFFKALNFFQNQDIKNLKEFNNFDYPHLGSFIWSFFWQFPFESYEYLGRIFYVFLYVLSIFSISNCLKLEIYEKIIFSILLISLTYNYKLFSGLQDVVIFSVILLFSRFSFIIFQKSYKINNTLIILIMLGVFNVLCWIKNEGIFYGLFLLISLAITYSFSKRDKILILFGSITILSLRLFLFNYYNTELNPGYFEMKKTLAFDLILIFYKLKTITFYSFIYVTQNPIYFLTIPLLIFIAFKYPIKNITKFVLYFLFLNIVFIYFTYALKMTEVELLIKASMSRVIFQTSGIYFLAIVIYINNYAKFFNFVKKK